jgi:Na+:H+ antiporter, NhaA family
MKIVFQKILKPFEAFFAMEASSSFLLAGCTLMAMIFANSHFQESYFHLLHLKILGLSLHHWINDGLMVIFFFVVGMEIKRELVVGELRSPKQAALPIAGAIGGMVGPALIYYFLNPDYPQSRGWGIPMATDIAFAVGVLSFFGKRIPLPLKIFLLALAIVDDLGAVLVIAFFYTSEISGPFLGLAALGIGSMVLIREVGVRQYWPYVLHGIFIWFFVLKSGVHATVAGVLIGLLTPLTFQPKSGDSFNPLENLVHFLHPYVSFGIMPIFALANAGVNLGGVDVSGLFGNSIFQGVALGLFLGKPVGILLACLVAVGIGFAQLPRGVGWFKMLGAGSLAGIGFTMALFVSSLALYPDQEIYSKTAILLGSVASAIFGSIFIWIGLKNPTNGNPR